MTSTRMRLAILTTTLIFLSQGYAQTWSIAAETQTVLNYRILILSKDASDLSRNLKDFRNDLERMGVTQGFGVSAIRSMDKNHSLSIGLNYANQIYRFDWSGLRFESQIDPNQGFVNPTAEPYEERILRSYRYVELPIFINRSFIKNQSNFRLGLGLVPKYLFRVEYSESRIDISAHKYERLNVGVASGLGYFYKVVPALQVGVNLIAQADVVPLKFEPNKEFLYSFRFGIGCIYQLKQK